MEAFQNRRFYGKMECLPLWPTYIGEKGRTLGKTSIYEGRFCFVVMRSTELGCLRSCSWCLWKALDEEGSMGLVP
jgi:hypothetical protein